MKKGTIKSWFTLIAVFASIILLIGCSTPMTPEEVAQYFNTPSSVHFNEAIYVQVSDKRPEEERKGTTWLERYIVTIDSETPEKTTLFFADDLAKILIYKKITAHAYPLKPTEKPPQNATVIKIQLLSWYGRVPDPKKLSKTEQFLTSGLGSKTVALDNQGHCTFSASMIHQNKTIDLGTFTGKYSAYLNRPGTMTDANNLSAAAADRAFVQFLKTFDKKMNH